MKESQNLKHTFSFLPDLSHDIGLSHVRVVPLELGHLGLEILDPGSGWLLWHLKSWGGFQDAGRHGDLPQARHEGGGHPRYQRHDAGARVNC